MILLEQPQRLHRLEAVVLADDRVELVDPDLAVARTLVVPGDRPELDAARRRSSSAQKVIGTMPCLTSSR